MTAVRAREFLSKVALAKFPFALARRASSENVYLACEGYRCFDTNFQSKAHRFFRANLTYTQMPDDSVTLQVKRSERARNMYLLKATGIYRLASSAFYRLPSVNKSAPALVKYSTSATLTLSGRDISLRGSSAYDWCPRRTERERRYNLAEEETERVESCGVTGRTCARARLGMLALLDRAESERQGWKREKKREE